MLKDAVSEYLKEHRLQFPEQARPRLEFEKALLFFGGQCFAFAFFLFALSPRLPGLWSGAGIHLTIILFIAGVGCMLVLAKKRIRVVLYDNPVDDELLSLIFADEHTERLVKKHIAVEIKRQGYISYRQLLAFGELQRHRFMRQENKSSAGAVAFIKALDDGQLS